MIVATSETMNNNNNNNIKKRQLRRRRACCDNKPTTTATGLVSSISSGIVLITMMMTMTSSQIQYTTAFTSTITSPLTIPNKMISSIAGAAAAAGGGSKKQYTYDGGSHTASAVNKSDRNNSSQKEASKKKKGRSGGDDEADRSRWVAWMTRGTRSSRPRHSDEIKMREAEELGGVPRSDRYSSCDWFHNTLSLPNSAILKAIRGPVLFMSCWAGFLSVLYRHLSITNHPAAKLMCLTSTPHSLMSSALSLLLVFKTNSAYQRFAEGRKIWENIINNSRDMYRMLNLYENEMGRAKRRRLQRLLAAFPYLLRHRIRPNLIMYRVDDEENVRNPEHSIVLYQDKARNDLDPEAAAVATQEENEGKSRRKRRPLYWVDKRTLPWRLLPQDALEACARSQNRPLWVCDRMAHELRSIPDGPCFTSRERLTLIGKVEKLSNSIGSCERIHQTAVPLNYARHSLRALSIWLFTLPLCLVSSLELATAPAVFLVSWLMFGIYEIGYSIEDPFQGTLRLSVLCDTIRRDVLADEVIRSTAFENNEEDTVSSSSSSSSSSSDNKYASEQQMFQQQSNTNDNDQDLQEEEEEDDEIEYESSPVVKESRNVLKIDKTQMVKKKKKKSTGGTVVEELPILPSKSAIWEGKRP